MLAPRLLLNLRCSLALHCARNRRLRRRLSSTSDSNKVFGEKICEQHAGEPLCPYCAGCIPLKLVEINVSPPVRLRARVNATYSKKLNVGAFMWPSAEAFIQFLRVQGRKWSKRWSFGGSGLLELGSGSGACGLCAANTHFLGARDGPVVLSDKDKHVSTPCPCDAARTHLLWPFLR
jgi:hypothetical protein